MHKLLVGGACAALFWLPLNCPVWAGPEFELRSVSSRPDAVSGDDVLVQLAGPQASVYVVQLNGRDVTSSFRETAESANKIALLTGLLHGKNVLELRMSGSSKGALELINYPLSGPIFSGPHQQPFVCQTMANGLGAALDKDCNVATRVQYYYKSTEPENEDSLERMITSMQVFAGRSPAGIASGFKRYDPRHPPADVAQTTTSAGRTVPYIVRREVGVINRAVYDIRFLHQPGEPLPNPWSRWSPGWNGRLLYLFGGGCSAGYRQGTLLGMASDEALLARGYAVVTSTLNILGNNCNDVVSAETLSMVKEHFIKRYGVPAHTIGWGDSGGAMQLYLIAQNYPGLLDGIIPYISFPDVASTVPSTSDCSLMRHVFAGSEQHLSDAQKSAVTGFATWRTCIGWGPAFAIDPRGCSRAIPKEWVYNPLRHPTGLRCDIYDNEAAVFGRDPKTGFALRPLDNTGVQYGLSAFNAGKMDAEEFVTLNERIGGIDSDGQIVAARTAVSDEVVRRAYRDGVVLTGRGGLPDTPIIDWRRYADDLGDQHDSYRSFATRARLVAANGSAANQVIMIDSRGAPFLMALERAAESNPETSLIAAREVEFVAAMDRWLDNVTDDLLPGTRAEKIARDRPADLADTCWTTNGEKISGPTVYADSGRCTQAYPRHADPRIAAGGPLTDDVLKCTLKPIRLSDYAQSLSNEQLQRLKAIFPSGVCDYSRPGIGADITTETWQHF